MLCYLIFYAYARGVLNIFQAPLSKDIVITAEDAIFHDVKFISTIWSHAELPPPFISQILK